jgi:hypothetical protein
MVEHGLVQVGSDNADASGQGACQRARDDPGTGGRLQYAFRMEGGQSISEVLSVGLENERAEIPIIEGGN